MSRSVSGITQKDAPRQTISSKCIDIARPWYYGAGEVVFEVFGIREARLLFHMGGYMNLEHHKVQQGAVFYAI